jgi:flagellar motor component MotA
MENTPVWQVVVWIVTGLLAIVTFFSQMAIKSVMEKLKQHGDDIVKNKMEIEQLKSLVALNTEADKHRMESLNRQFTIIADGIKDIRQSQAEQQQEVKTVDKRLTDFIIQMLGRK